MPSLLLPPYMELPRTYIHKQGFTLIEIVVVMGLLAILGSLGLIMSLDSYRSYAFRNERDLIVTVLQKARSQAINNVCLGSGCTSGADHGVHLQTGSYTIFQGTIFASANHSLDQVVQSSSATVQLSGLTDVVFSQLSGNAAPAGNITVSDGVGHSTTISINDAGRIDW